MEAQKLQLVEEAFDMYNKLLDKIKAVHAKSEEYLIPTRPTLDDLLYNAEGYMHEVFNCIAYSSEGMNRFEEAFIQKLEVYKNKKNESGANTIIESTFADVPDYIELANFVDKFAETNLAPELINDTLAICKKLMDVDGNTYADESSFTYSFIDMLKKYIKEK